MNLILSTCGTSILTSNLNGNDDFRKLLVRRANAKNDGDIPISERGLIREHIENRKRNFVEYDNEDAKRGSAELNGILAFYDGRTLKENQKDTHYLLTTDTWLGEETAKIVKLWLEKRGFTDIRVQ